MPRRAQKAVEEEEAVEEVRPTWHAQVAQAWQPAIFGGRQLVYQICRAALPLRRLQRLRHASMRLSALDTADRDSPLKASSRLRDTRRPERHAIGGPDASHASDVACGVETAAGRASGSAHGSACNKL